MNTSSGGLLLGLFYRPGIQSLGFTVESCCVLHHPSLLDEANISVINPGTIIFVPRSKQHSSPVKSV